MFFKKSGTYRFSSEGNQYLSVFFSEKTPKRKRISWQSNSWSRRWWRTSFSETRFINTLGSISIGKHWFLRKRSIKIAFQADGSAIQVIVCSSAYPIAHAHSPIQHSKPTPSPKPTTCESILWKVRVHKSVNHHHHYFLFYFYPLFLWISYHQISSILMIFEFHIVFCYGKVHVNFFSLSLI